MELENQGSNAFGDYDSAELQDGGDAVAAPGRAPATVLVADQAGVVVLPPGTELGDIRIEGRDLVVIGADGVRFVIPDGAIIVPQLVIDDVAIPPLNLAALLIGNEPQPAAGNTQSSGGNFASDVGPLQDAYGLGDLLPYTELAFPEPEEREIIPQRPDRDPTITIITVDQPAGAQDATASVAESALPARPGEPAGSNASSTNETTSGTIVFSSPDGVTSITINGVPFTGVGQTISSPRGTLQITSYDPVAGTIGFSYTLTDNLVGATLADTFVFAVTDPDGDVASATLTVSALDDAPTARNDTDLVPAGTYAAESGNVVTAAGTTSGAVGADTLGADNASISAIASVNVAGNTDATFDAAGNLQVTGQYGTLLIKADGSYSYTRAPGTPGGVNDVFTYTLTDSDGSASTANLTISIGDATPVITSVPPANSFDAGTLVFESGLPTRPGEAPGTDASAPTETTSGTVTFAGGDGPVTATINGVAVTPGATVTIPGVGTLTVTSFDPVSGSLTYSFTLADNTAGDDTSVSFEVVVTDVDGDSAPGTFTIVIRDDEPAAADDSATQATENAPVTIDLLANDTQGADSVQASTVAVVAGTLSGTGTIVNNGDGTVTYVPGPGESGTVTFDYTITDGDGDVSSATATVVLLADSTPTIAVAGDDTVDEAALGARPGEPAGSNAASTDETAEGDIAITTGGDTIGSLVINGIDVTAGGTVTTAKGTLTVTFAGGAYSYSYTLTDNTLADPDSDTFTLEVTDSDGDSAATTLVIAIADDAPSAADDAGSVAAGAYGPITGSVTANDTPGADGISVLDYSGVTSGVAGTTIDGLYGTLSIDAGGTYTYIRNPGTPGGVTDSFTYTVRDGDGDTATANLVITIGDSDTTLDIPVAGTPGVTQVLEEGLANGSNAPGDGEFASGTFDFTAPDGPAIVTIDGVVVTGPGQTFTGSFGTLTITSVAAGSIGYTYELTINTAGDTTFDDFSIVVEDQDGDDTGGTLRIDIVDDVPTANPDLDSVTEDGPLIATGNVITGTDIAGGDANGDDGVTDVQGADGATVTAVEFNPAGGGAAVGGTVGGTTVGVYGTLTLDADGNYRYELDNANALVQGLDATESLTETFTYTLTDGDGDPTTTTLTITINGSDDGITITGLNPAGAEETVFEANLPDGRSPDDLALTQTGTFDVTALDGIAVIKVGGETVYTGGAFVPGQSISTGYGTLTITNVTTVLDAAGDAVSATVSYSYTLDDNTLTHTAADDAQLTDVFTVEVTDTDGTLATDAIEVVVVDDTPDAIDDSVVQDAANEGDPITIDVFTNDVGGADGKVVGSVALVGGSLKLDGGPAGGILVNNGDGTFTYTPAPGESGTITFDYSVADGDNDTDIATATIVLAGDSVPMFKMADGVEVDEDGLTGANVDAAPTLQTMPDETDGTESATGSGTAVFAFGNDVPSVLAGSAVLVDTPALDGQLVTLSGQPVVFKLEGGDLVGRAGSDAGAEVIRIALTTAATTATPGEVAYGYTVTLSQPVRHATPGTEDTDLLSGVTIEVTDNDGDKTTGTFDVTVRDDVPSASDEAGGSVDEGATVTGTLDFVKGADGASVTAINGVTLFFDPVTGFSQGVTLFDAGGTIPVGTIMVKADGSYSFTANDPLDNPIGAVGTFTVTDGDLDTVTADIAFTVIDANAPTGGTATAAVDDDGRPTGNPASDTFDLDTNAGDAEVVASEATFEGTLTFSDGGDAPVTITFAAGLHGSFAVVGTERVQYSVAGDTLTATVAATDGMGNPQARSGTPLFSIEITDANAGTYKVTLLANVLHEGGPNEENPVGTDATASIGFTVTDSDGSTASATLDVTFDDDAPSVTSNAVTVTQATENVAFTFTLVEGLHYFAGADGVDLSQVTFSQPAQGTLTYDGAGTFTYTPADGAGSVSTMDSFTFTVVDGDGDTATKTVNVTLQPDSTPQVVDAVAAVDDDALGGNALADAATDIDANTFTDPDDLDGPASSEATFRGQLTVDFGSDGGTVSFANLNGDVVMLGTETITLAWAGTTLTGSSVARGDVFTVSLSPSGEYVVTLLKPVLHADGGQEASTTLALNYRAVDSDDADTVETGKLTITFNDDVPSANTVVNNAQTDDEGKGPFAALSNEGAVVGTDVVGSPATATGAAGSLFTIGADGFGSISITGPAGVMAIYDADGDGDAQQETVVYSSVTAPDGSVTLTATGSVSGQPVFTLKIDADGSYTFTQVGALVHSGAGEDERNLVFSFTATDKDGDPATGSLTVTADDDTPIANVVIATALTDDEGKAPFASSSIEGGTGDVTGSPATVTGLAGSLFQAGADGFGSLTISGPTGIKAITTGAASGTTGTSRQEDVVYDAPSVAANGAVTLTARGATSGEVVFTLTINNDGSYSFTQSKALVHSGAGEDDLALSFGFTLTDGDGDTASGSLRIDVDDDTPTNFAPLAAVTTNTGTSVIANQVLDTAGNGIFDNAGADGIASLTFAASLNGTKLMGASGVLQSGGADIWLYIRPDGSLVATTDSNPADGIAAGTTVFTAILNAATGTYTIDFDRTIDNGSGVKISDFSATKAGQNQWNGVDPDLVNGSAIDIGAANDPNPDSIDLLFTPSTGGTVNTSATDIGVSNQWIDAGEALRTDFVQDLRRDPGQNETDAGGYLYDDHAGVTQATFTILQAKSTAAVRITATNVDDMNAASQSNVQLAGINSPVNLDHSTIVVKNSAGTTLTAGVHYNVYDDGNAIVISGLDQGDSVTFGAQGNATFESFTVTNVAGSPIPGGGGNLPGDDFALGAFAYSSIAIGAPVSFSLPVVLTDGDGDTSTGSIAVTVNPVTPVVLDLDGDGVEFVGASAGAVFDYNGDGNAVATAWAGPDDGILALDANGNGRVDDGSEIVFGRDGMTDLEALAARYGDTLDADDADFAKFGVWRDADGDGFSDPGEFVSLADAGITSISLVSDGIGYTAANGEVKVFGSSTYTRADGSTGSLADAAFATQAKEAQRTAEIVTTAAVAGAMIHATAASAQPALAAVSFEAFQTVTVDGARFATFDPITDSVATKDLSSLSEARAGESLSQVEATAHFRGDTSAAELVSDAPSAEAESVPADFLSAAYDLGAGEGASLFAAMGTGGIMDSLLTMPAATVATAGLAEDHSAVMGRVMADFAGEAMIDGLLEHFAPGGASTAIATVANDDIAGLLDQGLGGGTALAAMTILPEAFDDASMLAAAQA